MKKFILGGLAAAAVIAPIALTSGSASAAEPARCQETAVTNTATTATFEAHQPAGAYGQWDNRWIHTYTVTVQPDGTFTGTGVVNGSDQNGTFTDEPETITGTFTDSPDADTMSDQVTFTATRTNDKVGYTLTNSLGTGSIAVATITVDGEPVETQQPVEFVVSMPSFVTVTDATA